MEEFDNTTATKGLDPSFFLPPNVIDLRYTSPTTGEVDGEVEGGPESQNADSEPVNEVPDTVEITDLTPESSSFLPVPETFTVISQTVRTKPGGGYTVDVVVDVGDLPGVENFDLAVTKA